MERPTGKQPDFKINNEPIVPQVNYWEVHERAARVDRVIKAKVQEAQSLRGHIPDSEVEAIYEEKNKFRDAQIPELMRQLAEKAGEIVRLRMQAEAEGLPTSSLRHAEETFITAVLIANNNFTSLMPGISVGMKKYDNDEPIHRGSSNTIVVTLPSADESSAKVALGISLRDLTHHMRLATGEEKNAAEIARSISRHGLKVFQENSDNDAFITRSVDGLRFLFDERREKNDLSEGLDYEILTAKEYFADKLLTIRKQSRVEGRQPVNFKVGYLRGKGGNHALDLLEFEVNTANRVFRFRTLPNWLRKARDQDLPFPPFGKIIGISNSYDYTKKRIDRT